MRTLKAAEAAVAAVAEKVGDPERAHSREDDAYLAFLKEIAKGMNQYHAANMAKILLKTQELNFPRWCA